MKWVSNFFYYYWSVKFERIDNEKIKKESNNESSRIDTTANTCILFLSREQAHACSSNFIVMIIIIIRYIEYCNMG